jgi:hypothetical protein
MSIDDITAQEARHVLAHFGLSGGYPAGAFTRTLIEAMTRADQGNLARLALGFPGYAAAVQLAQNDFGGADVLRGIAALPEVDSAP